MSYKEFNIMLIIIGVLTYKALVLYMDKKEAEHRAEDMEYLLMKERQNRKMLESRFEEYREEMLIKGCSSLEIDERIIDLMIKEREYFEKGAYWRF